MKRLFASLGAAVAGLALTASAASADCGKVTISEMNWAASTAARPVKSPLSGRAKRPSPAWSSVSSAVSSALTARYDFSRRSEFSALKPTCRSPCAAPALSSRSSR